MWASTSAEEGNLAKVADPKFGKRRHRERSEAPSKCARGGLCNGIAWMHGIRHVRRKGRGASADSSLRADGRFLQGFSGSQSWGKIFLNPLRALAPQPCSDINP